MEAIFNAAQSFAFMLLDFEVTEEDLAAVKEREKKAQAKIREEENTEDSENPSALRKKVPRMRSGSSRVDASAHLELSFSEDSGSLSFRTTGRCMFLNLSLQFLFKLQFNS